MTVSIALTLIIARHLYFQNRTENVQNTDVDISSIRNSVETPKKILQEIGVNNISELSPRKKKSQCKNFIQSSEELGEVSKILKNVYLKQKYLSSKGLEESIAHLNSIASQFIRCQCRESTKFKNRRFTTSEKIMALHFETKSKILPIFIKAKAKSVITNIETFEFVVYLYFWDAVLPTINEINLSLQGKNLDLDLEAKSRLLLKHLTERIFFALLIESSKVISPEFQQVRRKKKTKMPGGLTKSDPDELDCAIKDIITHDFLEDVSEFDSNKFSLKDVEIVHIDLENEEYVFMPHKSSFGYGYAATSEDENFEVKTPSAKRIKTSMAYKKPIFNQPIGSLGKRREVRKGAFFTIMR
ncbi:hypothetical protein FQA39_LY18470 [Lamprigera yunnana]|nr:hypothetical protein FQA39_LY18470 [Lamprigera yunnana]